MGKKKSKHSKGKYKKLKNEKRKNYNKKKKFLSKRETILSSFPEDVLDIWFGDDINKRNEFGNFLIEFDELNENDKNIEILGDNTYYDEQIDKIRSREHQDMSDVAISIYRINEVLKQEKKHKKYSKFYSKKDRSLAKYLDGKRYSKKYLNKSKYRKELKNIAKAERNEIKEMRSLGYIRNKDVDDELNKLKKANKMMENALSDSYVQKHFLK